MIPRPPHEYRGDPRLRTLLGALGIDPDLPDDELRRQLLGAMAEDATEGLVDRGQPRADTPVFFLGETRTVAQWARMAGIRAKRVLDRLAKGLSFADSLLTPLPPSGIRGKPHQTPQQKALQRSVDDFHARFRGGNTE